MKCKLKVIMAERNIKQKDLAKMSGVSVTQLSLLANQKSLPTLEIAYKIADALGMSVEEIWVREKE